MNHRIIALALLVLLVIAIGSGWILCRHPDYLGLCSAGTQCLSEDAFYGVAKILYFNIRPLLLLFLALIFVRREAFVLWAKIVPALSVIPVVLIANAASVPHGFFLEPSRAEVTDYMVRIILAASAAVIVLAYALLYGKGRGTSRKQGVH